MSLTSKHFLIPSAVVVICILVIGGFLHFRDNNSVKEGAVPVSENQEDTFTFFGIGPTTKLTEGLRDKLNGLLGDGSVETSTTIDLNLSGVDSFSSQFPRLQALHELLNYLPRQRVEHDTVQLTYRYARRQSVPFDRIRLVFSGKEETPLFFNLYSKRDGADFIETIQQKHGPPQTIGDENSAERTLYWQKETAFLIISITRNRIGFNEYTFGIYYLDNLAALAEAEQQVRKQAEKEKEKTGELAF